MSASRSRTSSPSPIVAAITQAIVVTAAMGAFVVPPAHGRMLLIPLGSASASTLITRNDTRLVARGPIAGSLVIDGDRAPIQAEAIDNGILILAAPVILCGTRPLPAAAAQ